MSWFDDFEDIEDYNDFDDYREFEDFLNLIAKRKVLQVGYQTAMDKPINHLQPHYTDDRFKRPQTVFVREGYKLIVDSDYGYVKSAFYNYSDRIWQWDWDKTEESRKTAIEKYKKADTAAYWEYWLQLVFDKPNLKLVHILAGFNPSNGYSYQVFGYFED